MGNTQEKFQIKIFVTGSKGVGKSALVHGLYLTNNVLSYYAQNPKFHTFEYKNSRFIIKDVGNGGDILNRLFISFKYLLYCLNYDKKYKLKSYKEEFWKFIESNEKCITSNDYILIIVVTKDDSFEHSPCISDEIVNFFELSKIQNVLWDIQFTSSYNRNGIDELKEHIYQIESFFLGFSQLPKLKCYQTKKIIYNMNHVKFHDLKFKFIH